MLDFPNAKINLGLNVTGIRSDGFHNIETVMIPVGFCDILENPARGGSNARVSSIRISHPGKGRRQPLYPGIPSGQIII